MDLAFYYHIPITLRNSKIWIPSYLGVFLNSLALYTNKLYLVMHSANDNEALECDYMLTNPNIELIQLGLKTPAWHRGIFHSRLLKKKLKRINSCSALIVRSPSPLAPYFRKYTPEGVKVIFLVVGDYTESVRQGKVVSFREWGINKYLLFNDYLFRKEMIKTNVIVNSPALYSKYKSISKSIHQIVTTTLSFDDFFERDDTCLSNKINILYTGRIDPLKGLFELIEASSFLVAEYPNLAINIVGWEPDINKPIEHTLKEKASELGILNNIIFHGRKSVGEELNKFYRMSDIYVIPSYEEGFPRTIWEAMANGLPVIATSVGAIPEYLTNEQNALLIPSKNVDSIVDAIKLLINNKNLRSKLIKNGREKARENILDIQNNKLISIIKGLNE